MYVYIYIHVYIYIDPGLLRTIAGYDDEEEEEDDGDYDDLCLRFLFRPLNMP